MDISSLPEAEQKQLQQLHQQFQEHQAKQRQQQLEQQKQNQDYVSQTYTQIHAQTYDQAYYSHHQQYEPHRQQYYDHYQPVYGTAYPQAPHQHQQFELAPLASAARKEARVAVSVSDRSPVDPRKIEDAGHQMVPGLDPPAAAAVAALSQLARFAGIMHETEREMTGFQSMVGAVGSMYHGSRAMHMPVGLYPNHEGGRRFSGPFGDAGWENFNHHYPRPGGSGLPFRGRRRARGKGRGHSRRFQSRGSSSSSHQEPPSVEGTELTNEESRGHSVDMPEVTDQEPQSATLVASDKLVPNKRPSKGAWCDVCRVECTSFEILEQHRNGKRHKKSILRIEESLKHDIGIQNNQNPTAKSEMEVLQQPDGTKSSEGDNQKENTSLEVIDVKKPKTETEHKNVAAAQPEDNGAGMSSEAQGRSDKPSRGMKRKSRGSRGGRNIRTSNSLTSPIEPPKPKIVIPLICDLCNIKCDTREVLARHLAGKKHMAKLKKFETHQAMYGPIGLKALYPPNPISQTLSLQQGHQQPLSCHEGSYHQVPTLVAAGLDPHLEQNSKPQGSAGDPLVISEGPLVDATRSHQNIAAVRP